MSNSIPAWALPLLQDPFTNQPLSLDSERLLAPDNREVGRVEQGVLRLPFASDDNVTAYREVGGAHFFERSDVAFAMSALDTPVYHSYLADLAPPEPRGVIVDVGGGDGRNSRPWLQQGFERVVVIDAVAEALLRFRSRVARENPAWLDRLLLVECDARSLPLRAGCAATVLAIESLYYLNEDYERGLREAVRILAAGGRILLSERDCEGGLLLRLLYDGIDAMLETWSLRSIVDRGKSTMSTRCFTEPEIIELLERNGLSVHSVRGTSVLAMVLGWMRNRDLLKAEDVAQLHAVNSLLGELGSEGRMRRCNVIVAERTGYA